MKIVRVASWIWLACALAACSSSHQKLDLGGTCSLNSDCNEPLLCKFGYCHKACARSVDCDNGGRCVTVDGVAVCQTQAESSCGANQTCSTGLVCRTVDNTCRTPCSPTNDTSCVAGQTCNGTVCLENKELASTGSDAAVSTLDGAIAPDAASDLPADLSGSGGGGTGGDAGAPDAPGAQLDVSSGGTGGGAGVGGTGGGDAGVPDVSGVQPDAPFGGADSGVDLVTAAPDVGMSTVDAALAPVDAFETPANLVAAPGTLPLGTVSMGQSSKEGHITISNQGQRSSGVITFHADNTEFVIQDPASGDCISGTTVLSAGANCTVWVVLTPVATGARTGTFAFQATPGGGGTVNLRGTGSCAVDTLPDAQGQCVPMAGAVWVQRGTQQNWYSVASSADGTNLVAAAFGGNLYTSTDSGLTWVPRDVPRAWWSVASSADGTKLVAVTRVSGIIPPISDGYIYTSTDAGANWSQHGTQHVWASVTSSADGSKLAALTGMGAEEGALGASGHGLHTSTDSGVTWTFQSNLSLGAGNSVASSADGMKLVVVLAGSPIYTSSDGGATWTARDPVQPWVAVASSEDGARLVALANGGMGSGGYIYTSVDSGGAWTERGSWQSWRSVASSSDGQRLVAAAEGGFIYTSIDGGLNWAQRGSVRPWQSVASSSDGTKLVAVATNGYIYTSAGPLP